MTSRDKGSVSGYDPETPQAHLFDLLGHLSHRLRFPSEPESPAATARGRAKPA